MQSDIIVTPPNFAPAAAAVGKALEAKKPADVDLAAENARGAMLDAAYRRFDQEIEPLQEAEIVAARDWDGSGEPPDLGVANLIGKCDRAAAALKRHRDFHLPVARYRSGIADAALTMACCRWGLEDVKRRLVDQIKVASELAALEGSDNISYDAGGLTLRLKEFYETFLRRADGALDYCRQAERWLVEPGAPEPVGKVAALGMWENYQAEFKSRFGGEFTIGGAK